MKRILFATAVFASFALNTGANAGVCTSTTGTTVFFVNGIFNSEEAAEDSRKKLSQLVPKDTRTFELSYNKTGKGAADVVESLYQKAGSYESRADVKARWVRGAVGGEDEMLRDAPPGLWGDIRNAVQQFVSSVAGLFGASNALYVADRDRHVAAYKAELAQGRGIALIGHSQGSLFVNDEMYILEQSTSTDEEHAKFMSSATGYFVAPAAASLYPGLVRDYRKLDVDMLAAFGIGLPGNWTLYANSFERDAVGLDHEDQRNHGFATTYINKSLAEKYPPFARIRDEVKAGIESTIASIEGECGWVQVSVNAPNGDTSNGSWVSVLPNLSAANPAVLRDLTRCRRYAEYRGQMPEFSPEACNVSISDAANARFGFTNPSLVDVQDSSTALPLNYWALDYRNQGVYCSRSLEQGDDMLRCLSWTMNPLYWNTIPIPFDLPAVLYMQATLRGVKLPIRCGKGELVYQSNMAAPRCIAFTEAMSLLL